MNKVELRNLIENMKVGDTFYNLKIELLNEVNTDAILQELARERNLEFSIRADLSNSQTTFIYQVIEPSKKFLNREGQWSGSISNKAKEYLKQYKESYI